MRKITNFLLLSLSFLLLGANISSAQAVSQNHKTGEVQNWHQIFAQQLSYLGHRNWVLIVDSAYPLQSSPAIKTIIADYNIESVTKQVLELIDSAPHVKPIVYQDKEFSYMKDQWSPGCEKLQNKMSTLLAQYNPNVIPHDEIFSKLDEASKLFNVVVVKTNTTIPYSSVFIELDCGYWNSDFENKLRSSMQ